MNKIQRSWTLAKASLEVLQKDKELLIFPIISSIGVFIVTLTFLVPTLLSNFIDNVVQTGIPVFGYVVMFLFYLVQYTVVFFCNTALVGAAMIRIRGGDPKVKDGFNIAYSRFLPILGWALVSATVGVILNMLSSQSKERGQGLGAIISKLFGAAWNVVTFLVVPVVAIEGLGPIKAIERSWNLLKRSWGEQISGTLSIGAVFFLVGFGLVLLLGGLGIGLTIWLESAVPVIVFAAVLVLVLMALGLFNTTLSGIFSAAVYAYAADGQVGLIDESLVRSAVIAE